jgi:hypothetical protein
MPDIKTVGREGLIKTINTGELSRSATLTWNSSLDDYVRFGETSGVTSIHHKMKRCLLLPNGVVNYYLDPLDSTKKADGSNSVLTGADGNVMVEIPKFYFKYERNGNNKNWRISEAPGEGFTLHPAFIKGGVEVDYRYMGAYDACFFDASAGDYKSGLNLDNATSLIDFGVDKLASVSGVYPLVGVQRSECRTLASNIGSGWHQQDFWLSSAVQLLYLVEYGDFNSQAVLGAGNTNGSYLASSSNQNDSPHTIAGASNSWGNFSTDGTQPSAGAKPGTAYMSYRGIENFFGNCWNWVDGLNILTNHQAWVTNNYLDFVDNVSTNMRFLGSVANANGFVVDIIDADGAFLPSNTSGGSSSTFLTDNYFQTTGNRVALLGGNADSGSNAGAFFWRLADVSSFRARSIGARVCY